MYLSVLVIGLTDNLGQLLLVPHHQQDGSQLQHSRRVLMWFPSASIPDRCEPALDYVHALCHSREHTWVYTLLTCACIPSFKAPQLLKYAAISWCWSTQLPVNAVLPCDMLFWSCQMWGHPS